MIFATRKTEHKELVRVEPKAVKNWSIFLVLLTVYRMVMYKFFPEAFALNEATKGSTELPWQMTLFVFWEDACHGLPLLLLKKMLGNKWLMKPFHFLLMLMVMFSFGLGHTYQGVTAAIILSFYIPASMNIADRRGFGTVMICHTLYDLSTVFFVRWIMGQ